MPKDQRTGESRGIAFIEYSHRDSVPYALQVFVGTKLHSRPLVMRSRNNTNPVPLTPQYIEANNPLTAPGSSLRYGYQNGHMQPNHRQPVLANENPFDQFTDPALLMALTANLVGGGGNQYQDLGRYDQRDDDRSYKHRGNNNRRHDEYNPYKNEHDRRDGGGGGYRDRDRDRGHGGRDWTNGSRNHSNNRKRY